MQKLMPMKEWMEKRFTTPPDKRTVQNWCNNGDIPAKKIGGLWFVMVEEELLETGNPVVDAILKSTMRGE